ncbi:unnamed protein product [Cuscuta europaea]|uniref:Homeobox domain-containing protein n=1 Tax=Cuscuta europaea TaxID=41803 RepID=A0A9P0YUD8_CUSEU|nr:unnamed protein product [Cuscuta europaea]
MEARSNHGSGYHVLEQSRREKLRNQNILTTQSSHHLVGGGGDCRPNLEQLSLHHHSLLNADQQLPDGGWRYGIVPCDSPSILSSEMLCFPPNPQLRRDDHSQMLIQDSSTTSNAAPRFGKFVVDKGEFTNTWKNIESHWKNIDANLTPMFGYQEIQDTSHLNYPNALQEVVTSASASYVDHSSQTFVNAQHQHQHQQQQALSLSLSSASPTKPSYLGHHNMSNVLTFTHRDLVPLGPFTGYAAILKSSRFLKPAQQLLDQLCHFDGNKELVDNMSEVCGNIIEEEVDDDVNVALPCSGGSLAVDSGGSSSTLYSSSVKSHEFRDLGGSNEAYKNQPEFLQNKIKLLYMQDEVSRRYRQYHQQMQMVVSSFESVPGLGSATPYIPLALKSVLRQFRSFKNAISHQLKSIRKALGEDRTSSSRDHHSNPTAGGGGGRSTNLKLVDPNARGGGERLPRYLEPPQTHIWRPQRGLPERAVAVLRAWLFDHFLHPYPTDTDKHMLAAQTGLTRNQVSNWFINARVRVWKPMVEEIHTLETKTLAENGQKDGKVVDGQIATKSNISQPNEDRRRHPNRLGLSNDETLFLTRRPEECPAGNSQSPGSLIREQPYHDTWKNQDKRSRIDFGLPVGIDNRPFMAAGFTPYQRNGLEMGGNGGLGAVSLTLGLRQSIEGGGQHDSQLRQGFGGRIIHDFAG